MAIAGPNLTPVPAESSTCAGCGAPLVADQRYCLDCGAPVSPVRLAFLDVLQSERQAAAGAGSPLTTPVAYAPLLEPVSPSWLRRYAPLFGVLSVLLLALLIGLLIGHWVTQSKSPGQQVLKVEGLSAAPATAAAAAPTSTTPAPNAASASASAATKKEQAEEAKQAKAEKVAPPPPPVKVSSSSLQKVTKSTGKKHEEEVAKLGNGPIETGGGSSKPAPSSSESNKPIGGGSKVESIE